MLFLMITRKLGLAVFAAVAALFLSAPSAKAAPEPEYDMNGTATTLWDQDTDYFSPPILLHRNSTTFDLHRIEFTILRYTSVCMQWQQVCVAWNPQGKCIAWETRCVQWGLQESPVEKRIDLNFRGIPDLAAGQAETSRLHIHRDRPFSDGEDRVSTWLESVSTVVPVKIFKVNEFDYRVDPK
jgi:hypothetical protein